MNKQSKTLLKSLFSAYKFNEKILIVPIFDFGYLLLKTLLRGGFISI